jgi:3D (Asp-Asp-Asp) domain-containing protein
LILYAHPSIAEDLAQQNKQETQTQTKTETAGASLSEGAPLLVAADEVKLAAAPVIAEVEAGPPPESKRAIAPTITMPTQTFTATAYSLRGRTASGLSVTRGLIAADRRVLPLGTRVRLEAGTYSGEYLVADTGGLVRGRKIDIWVPNSGEAMRFGRRTVKLTVLTYGGRRATQTGARSRK